LARLREKSHLDPPNSDFFAFPALGSVLGNVI
jgi:hypothetical protein